MAMKETVTRVKTYITSLVERLRSRSGSLIWRVTSYWPMLAAAIVGLPVALMPMWLDLSAWVYVFSLPLGITAGVLGYLGAYMMLYD